jgi:GTPase-associated system helical domain
VDVIGELLRAGLLTQIGEAEDRVEFVRAASASLADRLGSDLRPLVPHALVAGIDGSGLGDVEAMVAADEALSAEWSTYRNAFTEPPAEILRAMLVAAVASAAEKDADLRAAGW